MFKYGNLARVSILDPIDGKITGQGYVVSRQYSRYGNLYSVQDKFGNCDGPINESLLVPNHSIKFTPKAIRPGALVTIRTNSSCFSVFKDKLNPKRYYSITQILDNEKVRLIITNGKTIDVPICFLKAKR